MKGKTIGVVIEHRKPGFLEFQFMPKHDFNKGIASSGTMTWFIPIIKYNIQGQEYIYNPKSAFRGYRYLDIGETVELEYNPANPAKCKLRLK